MKKIIIILIIAVFFCCTAQAQRICNYDTCNALRQYEGEWKYINGTDTIKIYLKYHQYKTTGLNPSSCFEVYNGLFGWQEYKHGNTIVESNYQNRFLPLPYDGDDDTWFDANPSIDLRMAGCNDNDLRLSGSLSDFGPSQPISHFRVYTTLNAAKNIMTWHQYWAPYYAGNGTTFTGMAMPADFVLIKQ